MSRAVNSFTGTLIDADDLEEYPDDLMDARMTSDYFTMFWHDRWLNSTLHLTAGMDVQGAALNLFFIARKQNPIGSLPDDDAILAKLLRLPLDVWQDLRARSVGPLHRWRRMRAGDQIVLGHPVVIDVARDAMHRRAANQASSEEKAIYARQKRLRELMSLMKCSKAMIDDAFLVERLDHWLLENHRGQRRMPQFEQSMRRALMHAGKEGWINGFSGN